MEELKTLKDLGCDCNIPEGSYCIKHDTNNTITHQLLKEIVIKWIKELRSNAAETWTETHPFYTFRHDTDPIIEFLMNRFNITDEDLKECH